MDPGRFRFIVYGALLAVPGLLWPGAASADLVLVFGQGRASPGERVIAFSGDHRGVPENWSNVRGVTVYLVPMSHAKSPRHQTPTGPPDDPAWVRLGRLHQDRNGVAHIAFTVPRTRSGSYTLGFWCLPCAPPSGATFTQAYPGTVATGRPYTKILTVDSSGGPARRRAPASDHRRLLLAAGALGVIALGLALKRAIPRTDDLAE